MLTIFPLGLLNPDTGGHGHTPQKTHIALQLVDPPRHSSAAVVALHLRLIMAHDEVLHWKTCRDSSMLILRCTYVSWAPLRTRLRTIDRTRRVGLRPTPIGAPVSGEVTGRLSARHTCHPNNQNLLYKPRAQSHMM